MNRRFKLILCSLYFVSQLSPVLASQSSPQDFVPILIAANESSKGSGNNLKNGQEVLKGRESNSQKNDGVVEDSTPECAQKKNGNKDRGNECFGKHDYKSAIKYLSMHTNENPNDSLSLARVAISYSRLGLHNEAIPAYKDAIAKNWISYDFSSLYSESLFQTGNTEEALKWSKRSFILAPECTGCRRQHAEQLRKLGRSLEALNILKEYDELQVLKGKPQVFQGPIMLLEDDLKK